MSESTINRPIAFDVLSDLPARHREATVSNSPPWSDWYAATMNALLCDGVLLLVCGSRGSGKTQLCVEAVRDLRSRTRINDAGKTVPAVSCRYVHALDLFLNLRSGYKREGPSEEQLVESFCRPRVLFIDEIHERGESEWEDRMLRRIIDRRYGDKKDTVLVGNDPASVLLGEGTKDNPGKLGMSIRSRFLEIGETVECVGVNFRKG